MPGHSEVNNPIADALIEAHRHRRRFRWDEKRAPVDLDQVYRIQDQVCAALDRGVRPSAWKVSPPRDDRESTASPVPGVSCAGSPAHVRAPSVDLLGVEVEIAFRFARDLPPGDSSLADDETILSAVAEALVAIELCETRLTDWETAPPLWRLADFQSNGLLVSGSGTSAWRTIDLTALEAQLWINGTCVRRERGSHPVGDPSTLLPWLARHVAQRCGGLRGGDVVTTGSWTGMHAVAPGDAIEARFPSLGEALLTLGA